MTEQMGKSTITHGLCLRRSEVLRSLRHYLQSQTKDITPTAAWRKGSIEKGSSQRSTLKGRDRTIVNHTNIETVLKATLGDY